MHVPEEWPSIPPKLARAQADGQNPAYRPSDALSLQMMPLEHLWRLTGCQPPRLMSCMNHASRKFWELYLALPEDVRARADKGYRMLEENPRHPSLKFKRVKRFWSVRVDENYRALGVDAPDGIVWFWIGRHSEYDRLLNS